MAALHSSEKIGGQHYVDYGAPIASKTASRCTIIGTSGAIPNDKNYYDSVESCYHFWFSSFVNLSGLGRIGACLVSHVIVKWKNYAKSHRDKCDKLAAVRLIVYDYLVSLRLYVSLSACMSVHLLVGSLMSRDFEIDLVALYGWADPSSF